MEFSHPGVYTSVEKQKRSASVGNSTVVYAPTGFTTKGRTDKLIIASSFTEFENKCGGFSEKTILPTMVFDYFQNGGSRVVVNRVVGENAEKADCFFLAEEESEEITVDPTPDGSETNFVFALNNALSKVPLVPGSLTISDGAITFEDQGDGTLTDGAGSTGTIDYVTGEGTLSYDSAPAGAVTIEADYLYKTFYFKMIWEGNKGNDYRMLLKGDSVYFDPNTASYSRYTLIIQEKNEDGVYEDVPRETYDGISLTDSTDSNYISTVINDEIKGSNIVAVTVYNSVVPAGLNGVEVSDEALTPDPAYDGTERAFTYDIANEPQETSFKAIFTPVTLGANAGTPASGDTDFSGDLGQPVDVSQLDTVEIIAVTDVGNETFTNSTTETVLDGTGDGVGTINADGTFTLDLSGGTDTFSEDPVTASFRWGETIEITDDGNGNLDQEGGNGVWLIDPNATNKLKYSDKELDITWRYASNPTVAPEDHASLANLVWSQTADYYIVPDYVSRTSAMTDGFDGDSIERADITLATLESDKGGIYALDNYKGILIVAIPNFETDYLAVRDLIEYCSSRGDRFSVYTPPEGLEYTEAVNWFRNNVNKRITPFHACFYPHVKIVDPLTENTLNVPTSGHIVGRLANAVAQQNPARSLAGKEYGALKYAIGLERELGESEVGYCTENQLNCLVNWDSTGLAIWGSHTGHIGGEYNLITMMMVRMYTIAAIEPVLFNFVFDSNDASTREQIRLTVSSIMLNLYRSGWYKGATFEQAVKVICDDSNNTAVEEEQGVIIIDVGIRYKKEAKFLWLRLKQRINNEG